MLPSSIVKYKLFLTVLFFRVKTIVVSFFLSFHGVHNCSPTFTKICHKNHLPIFNLNFIVTLPHQHAPLTSLKLFNLRIIYKIKKSTCSTVFKFLTYFRNKDGKISQLRPIWCSLQDKTLYIKFIVWKRSFQRCCPTPTLHLEISV